jgi:membrane-bound lytic murein transglycosylase
MKLVSQLQGKDAMKVSASTFQVVIQQEIAERKTAIAKVEQDMSAWGQKIETLEKELLVQHADLESLKKAATGLAVQLQAITEPLGYQKVNEKLKDSVLALRFAEVKVKAEASHLKRLTQRYDGMKTAFKRWESTQMSQMQRLMEMQKELELKVGFDKVSEQLRGQTAQGDHDFNALFQTLLKLDQEGVLPTGSIQDTRTADQAASLQQGVDKALLEMEQMSLVEGFLKEMSDKAASEAAASVKKAQS